jgi:hypothetical protein
MPMLPGRNVSWVFYDVMSSCHVLLSNHCTLCHCVLLCPSLLRAGLSNSSSKVQVPAVKTTSSSHFVTLFYFVTFSYAVCRPE